jgi:hypothetical protein
MTNGIEELKIRATGALMKTNRKTLSGFGNNWSSDGIPRVKKEAYIEQV